MKITRFHVNNYRMLQNMDINLEDQLSLIIGRNNCGKTSLLTVLERFIGSQSSSNHFTYNDFNSGFQDTLYDAVTEGGELREQMAGKGIELYIYIRYEDGECLDALQPLLMDLDENIRHAVLKFEYTISADQLEKLAADFAADCHGKEPSLSRFDDFMDNRHKKYFSVIRKALLYDNATNAADESVSRTFDTGELNLNRLINFRCISARRDTRNKEDDASLSSLSSKYYDQLSTDTVSPAVNQFEDAIAATDTALSHSYEQLFSDVIGKVRRFGGVRQNETDVQIISTLSHRQLLQGNTTMVYANHNHQLPESYNGLGYLNLISMIMEIELYMGEFARTGHPSEEPAAINLLFIEEPEAHTHPQLQAVFIKNITELLFDPDPARKPFNLQALITTHSAHMVAESDFDTIKYFQRTSPNSVISKDLKELKIAYKKEGTNPQSRFKFLKQYLTINRAEIFFADKAILFEGETEAALLPAMLKKLDDEKALPDAAPFLSQNISRIAVGAYSHIFDEFLAFLGIKALIITDLDAVNADRKSCPVNEGVSTSNAALKHFYAEPMARYEKEEKEKVKNKEKAKAGTKLDFLVDLNGNEKVLRFDGKNWVRDPDGPLMIVYQIDNDDSAGHERFQPRSFEDAFFHINRDFMNRNADEFKGLKNHAYFNMKADDDPDKLKYNAWDLAANCVGNKSSLALDILFHGTDEDGKIVWEIPRYIKEGLLWLGQD